MYEEMNDKGSKALVGVAITNILKMTEHQYRDNFQHQPLKKGSQLLALGEKELRNIVGNFIRWGINNNSTALQALNDNPIVERQFPNGMQSGKQRNVFDLALMFTNLYGLEDDLEVLQKRAAADKQANQARATGLEESQGSAKRKRPNDQP